jgi:hypothetical protein
VNSLAKINTATSTRITVIRAELIGSNRAEAFGMVARSYAPLCALARKLIRAGLDPGLPIEAYRSDVLALRGRSLAEVAQLTVEDRSDGPPRFRWYRSPSWEVAPQTAQNRSGVPRPPPIENKTPAVGGSAP